jgi:predicted deacetylase
MKVAIRDDDACYFTPPETLERVYRDVWDLAPVCLATVPFAIGYQRPGIPQQHWTSGESFGLERNEPLVSFLRQLVSRGQATIALHGYTHQDYPTGSEFQAAPDPERRVSHGLRYLEETLGTRPSIFVPPHNALSRRGLMAVSHAGLDLLGSFLSFRPSMRPWDGATLANWWRVNRFRAATGRKRADRFVYPYVLRYQRHAEFGCHSLIPSTRLELLIEAFEEARVFNGDFCLATHYWEVDARMKEVLLRFLEHAAAVPEVKFVRAEELFQ